MKTTIPLTTFKEIASALDGTGIFAGGGALIQYPSEMDEQFQRRQAAAWYVNDLRSACQRFVGYLAKRPPIRSTTQERLLSLLDDCDWRGNSLDVFWQDFAGQAKARGSMLVLVEMPRQEQQEERPYPYLAAIAPEDVTEYRLDEQGLVAFLEIGATVGGKDVIRGWDSAKWWVREGDKTLAQGDHALGVCPVLAFTESGDFPHKGDFSEIVPLSKRLINLNSEHEDGMGRQNFAVFVNEFPLLNAVEGEQAESLQARQKGLIEAMKSAVGNLGKERGLVSPGPAYFVAPQSSTSETYERKIAAIEEKIKEVGLDVSQPGEKSAESGLALSIRFQSLNAALTSFARRMEDFERRVWSVACLWLGLPTDAIRVQWSRDYQIADPATELATLSAMQASAFPPSAIRAQQRAIAQTLFANSPAEELEAVLAEIDEAGAEVQVGDLEGLEDAP